MTYKQQYNAAFALVTHVNYWSKFDWMIEADYSKMSINRGWRRLNRIHNEVDVRHPAETYKCGLFHQLDYNRRNYSNSHLIFNTM